MGDGKLYAHKEEQLRIKCGDCHFTDTPKTVVYQDLDAESKKIVALRKWPVEDVRFISGSAGVPIVNAWIDEQGQAVLSGKNNDTLLSLGPPEKACSRGDAHRSLSCGSCHSSWVPQCIGCHNTYDKGAPGYDMLENKLRQGTWAEHVSLFMADQPALGIMTGEGGLEEVITFTPGMILSIDTSSFKKGTPGNAKIFRRLYAPASPHTTTREGRTCKSCHLNPLAIGYGRGELVYRNSHGLGKFEFFPRFAMNEYDQLPEDAWIGFLLEPEGMNSTRSFTRPFTLKEQQSILTVGACLTCHAEDSGVMKESLNDFPGLLKKTSNKCVLPGWK
jgi:hypothetical protein